RNTSDLEDPLTSETNLLTNEQIENILIWSDFKTFTDETIATTIKMRNHFNNKIPIEQISTETTTSTSHNTQQVSTIP
ncbi:9509_t:CDS:1, partial [Acaulospora morrowiae]